MRPFRILGVQQIAIGGPDKERLSGLWVDLFGLDKTGSFRSETENVDEYILRAGQGNHAVEIDLMQPLDPAKSPRVHQPPLNHIGLWVDDIDRAVEWLQARGLRFAPGGIRTGAGGHRVAFVHPRGNEEFPVSGEGVLIELVQAPPHIIRDLS